MEVTGYEEKGDTERGTEVLTLVVCGGIVLFL